VVVAQRAKGQPVTIVVLAIVQLADLLTTSWALSTGGIERNPMASAILAQPNGVLLLASLKATLVVAIGLMLVGLPQELGRGVRVGAQAASIVMAFVVLSNAGIALH
jgi:hypothetical protein